jgi:hypothetical protein
MASPLSPAWPVLDHRGLSISPARPSRRLRHHAVAGLDMIHLVLDRTGWIISTDAAGPRSRTIAAAELTVQAWDVRFDPDAPWAGPAPGVLRAIHTKRNGPGRSVSADTPDSHHA